MDIDWQLYVETPPMATSAALSGVESRLAVKIPDDLRTAFIQNQGLAPLSDVIDLPNGGQTAFGPLLFVGGTDQHPEYTYSVNFAIDALKEWAGQSDDTLLKLLPFGTNTGSGWFCLDYRTSLQHPSVVFVDTGYDMNEAGAITPVGSTFTDVLAKLH